MKKTLLWLLVLMMSMPLMAVAGEERTEEAFIKALHAAQVEKGHIDFWTVEERFEFQEPWQDMIRARTDDPYRKALFGLPDAADIDQDRAVQLAKDAVRKAYGNQAFDAGRDWDRESIYFWVYDTGEHEWQITFYSKESGSSAESIPYYDVRIDAKLGTVTKVETFSDLIRSNPGR